MPDNKLAVKKIYFGGDYNPEQWDEEVWAEDMRLMRLAGVNMVTLGVFSWALLEPADGCYEFGWLDKMLDMLHANGIAVNLATSTAAPPAWLTVKYPEVFRCDVYGRPVSQGGREHYCHNNPVYRRKARQLVRELAGHCRNHPALAMWHINNEMGNTYCYCPECQAAFRRWLEKRYASVGDLNSCWGIPGHYRSFDEVFLPERGNPANNPAQDLDSWRFNSDSILECYLNEKNVLREITPDLPVIMNFVCGSKYLDIFKWAEQLDYVTWDSYPYPTDMVPLGQAYWSDVMRGAKNGQPFLLMEQVATFVNWMPHNVNKRPGTIRLWSYQTIAHGGDAAMFFQWRASSAGAEKFHGAMLSHYDREDGRAFRELTQLGNELQRLDEIAGAVINARVAIVFDWQNWWAVEAPGKPGRTFWYPEHVSAFYGAFYKRNIAVDFVAPDGDLSKYRLVVAPLLYQIRDGVAENLQNYVHNGGKLLATYGSFVADGNERALPGGAPGVLRELLGLRVPEHCVLADGETVGILWQDRNLRGTLQADLPEPETAQVLAEYRSGWFAGKAAFTVNNYGEGQAYYLASRPDADGIGAIVGELANDTGVEPLMTVPENVEVTCRENGGHKYWFVMNHNDQEVYVDLVGQYDDLLACKILSGRTVILSKGILVLRKPIVRR